MQFFIHSQAKLDGVVNTLLADRGNTPEVMEKELKVKIKPTTDNQVYLWSTHVAPQSGHQMCLRPVCDFLRFEFWISER